MIKMPSKAQAALKPVTKSERLHLAISYTLLAFLGVFGAHRLYNRQFIIGAAQALFSVYFLMMFGTWTSVYLGILLLGWLIMDAVHLPSWSR